MTRHFQQSASLAIFVVLLFTTSARVQEKPLPLDPLTPQERELATKTARADARVREMLGNGRTQQITADFISVKRTQETEAQKDQPSHRYADVLFYRYDGDLGVRALVDLDASAVVDVVRVNGESVPIATEEIEEAGRLALADARVVRLFGGSLPAFQVASRPASQDDINRDRIEGLRTLGASPSEPCYRHRCIALFFRIKNQYVHLNEVVVDLTSQQVHVQLPGGVR